MAVGALQLGAGGVVTEMKRAVIARPTPAPTPPAQQSTSSPPEVPHPAPQVTLPVKERTPSKPPPRKELSPAEYLAMLRRMNLTYNLFEIRANYHYDKELGMVRVEIRNTVTGELIRRIPPYDPYRPIPLDNSARGASGRLHRIDLQG